MQSPGNSMAHTQHALSSYTGKYESRSAEELSSQDLVKNLEDKIWFKRVEDPFAEEVFGSKGLPEVGTPAVSMINAPGERLHPDKESPSGSKNATAELSSEKETGDISKALEQVIGTEVPIYVSRRHGVLRSDLEVQIALFEDYESQCHAYHVKLRGRIKRLLCEKLDLRVQNSELRRRLAEFQDNSLSSKEAAGGKLAGPKAMGMSRMKSYKVLAKKKLSNLGNMINSGKEPDTEHKYSNTRESVTKSILPKVKSLERRSGKSLHLNIQATRT